MINRPTGRTLLRAVASAVLAVLIAATTALGDPAATRGLAGSFSPLQWLEAGSALASPFEPLLDAVAGGTQKISDGNDGRLTFLLLGSDTRGGGVGRTDTIMIVQVAGGTIRAASIPRDTARIPDYVTGAGGNFHGRVNAIAKKLVKLYGITPGLAKFKQEISILLGVEIDHYALVTFRSFEALVDQVDPITLDNTQNVRDSRYWDSPNKQGVWFPIDSTYDLHAYGTLCGGLSTACHRALPFVRSRKGPGNSDFKRAARQQNFVATVAGWFADYSDLNDLADVGNSQANAKQLYTDVDISFATGYSIWELVHHASFGAHVVFKPTTYSTHISGTTAYWINVSAIRSWVNANMK